MNEPKDRAIELLKAAKTAAKWMRWWLDQEFCDLDCDVDNYICPGTPECKEALDTLEAEIARVENEESNSKIS